jgi:1,4-dihydroxy-6-naphthoate synthase
MKTLRFGFSPCPNDTFQFFPLIEGLIDTGDLRFEPVLADVEVLNQRALTGELEMTKASFGALSRLLPTYWCLRSGGALGNGCGPLWVTKKGEGAPPSAEELSRFPIAHPGENTTAYLLLKLRLGRELKGAPMIFHEVMQRVAANEFHSGVIIHEGRFTYREQGLVEVEDLGSWWEATTGAPIPLGCILLKRDQPGVDPKEVEEILRQSLRYSRAHPGEVMDYVRSHAQELDDEVIANHIELYVNEYSLNLGEKGTRAVTELLERQAGIETIESWEGKVFP